MELTNNTTWQTISSDPLIYTNSTGLNYTTTAHPALFGNGGTIELGDCFITPAEFEEYKLSVEREISALWAEIYRIDQELKEAKSSVEPIEVKINFSDLL